MSVYTQRDTHPFGHRISGCTFQLEGHAVTAGRLGAENAQGFFWRTAMSPWTPQLTAQPLNPPTLSSPSPDSSNNSLGTLK